MDTAEARPQRERGRWYVLTAVIIVVVLGVVGVIMLRSSGSTGPDVAGAETEEETARGPLTFVVDEEISPYVAELEGLGPGDPPRPTGAFVSPSGSQTDLVLGELVVGASSEDALAPLLERWDGQVVGRLDPPEGASPDDPIDFLVRVDPSGVDTGALADNLRRVEPDQRGRYRVGDQAALELLAVAIEEVAEHGFEAGINDLAHGHDWPVGEVSERDGIGGPDALRWRYMTSGPDSNQDIGVSAAWQLLAEEGRSLPNNRAGTVAIVIHDGGFVRNDDLPPSPWVTLHDASWGDENRGTCGGGRRCPWHGTHVALAALAQVDNDGYGTVGPAGPIASLHAVQDKLDWWGSINQLNRISEQYRPDVINMSYSRDVSIDKDGVRRRANRRYRAMAERGALLVGSAGNDGRNVDGGDLILPCESEYVVCVGGMGWNTTELAKREDGSWASNYGTNPNKPIERTVELYGPFQVLSIEVPPSGVVDGNPVLEYVGGTSFASPFVAGVAALVRYADRSLGPDDVREILRDTANRGGLGSAVTGPRLRINAFRAVAHALGYPSWGDPTVQISASGLYGGAGAGPYQLGEEISFEVDARDHRGKAVQTVRWTIAGHLDEVTHPGGTHTARFIDSLPVGRHTLTVTATDLAGYPTTRELTVEVVHQPLEVGISHPDDGVTVWAGEELELMAWARQGGRSITPESFEWEVARGGVVHTGSGRDLTVPAHVLVPGTYRITLTGRQRGETDSASVTVTAQEKPVHLPTITMHSPEAGSVYVDSGPGATIEFSGSAVDGQGDPISGLRFRWIAQRLEDGVVASEVVVCAGAEVGGPSGRDCADLSRRLRVHEPQHDEDATDYRIILEVTDADGETDAVTRVISVRPPKTA